MLHQPLRTARSFTGIVLLAGGVLFQGSAWIPLTVGPPTPLTNRDGTPIYSLPTQAQLEIIAHHQTLWWWTNVGFTVSTLLTLLGLALLAILLWEAGDRLFAPLGLILFIVAASLWVVQRAVPLSVDPWVVLEFARTHVVPDFYVLLTLWTQALFVIYTLLAYGALLAYAGAILSTRVMPRWLGWLTLTYGLAGLALVSITGNAPPFLYYLLPLLIGALLLFLPTTMGTHS